MRKIIAALALGAAASSVMLGGSAQAATRAGAPAGHPELPGYECYESGPVPTIFPPMAHGKWCAAVNGAPEGGIVGEPVWIAVYKEHEAWLCRAADAKDYPKSVLGFDCRRIHKEDHGH